MEQTIVPVVTIDYLVTALICGGMLGFILQRGRFCMNSAFRDTIFIQDFTLFRSYLVALGVLIVGSNLLNDMGMMELKPQSFYPVANIVGGYLFGLGMVLAGGCGSGIYFKTGEGQLAAGVAVLGFLISAGATATGMLKPLYDLFRSYKVELADPEKSLTLYTLIGDGMVIKWGVIAAIAVAIFVISLKGKPFSIGKQKGLYWSVTGVLLGLTGVITFWASQVWGGGFARGMNFTTPTAELINTLVSGDAKSKFFPMSSIGISTVTWGEIAMIAVPLGSFISAKILKEFSWKLASAKDIITVFLGSLLMGFSGITAGGCNVGQGLTGVATLSIGSILATIAMIFGNWTMVYFKFIKPMNDME
ncbi:MAG: YeeE/YedE family protein [Nitrospirae bacterium]|nr:YeeE/YedE family protein [Nitrospirota bacterium]